MAPTTTTAAAKILDAWAAQGLPPTIEDPSVLARVAAVLTATATERRQEKKAA